MSSQYESNSAPQELESKQWRHPLALLVLIVAVTGGLIGLLGLLVAF